MKKNHLIKKTFTIILAFILTSSSYAAIVSDNDGSAFVTKAEFETLKKSFASQIVSYNDSIDKKIDGAIASYLAGIKLSSTETIKAITKVEDTVSGCIPNFSQTAFTKTNYTNVISDCDWYLSNPYAIANAGDWYDVTTGVVSPAYADNGLSQYLVSNVAQNYYQISISSSDSSYGFTSRSYSTYPETMMACTHTGVANCRRYHDTAGHTSDTNVVHLFVDSGLCVKAFNDKQPFVIDSRWTRGLYGNQSTAHYVYTAGVNSGSKPAEKSFSLNTLYDTSDLAFRAGNSWAQTSDLCGGTFYITKKTENLIFPSKFIYTGSTGYSVRAYDNACEKVIIDKNIDVQVINNFTSADNERLSVGTYGLVDKTPYYYLPHITWNPITKSVSTIHTDAKDTTSSDPYARIKIEKLKVQYGDDETNVQEVFAGVPVFKATRGGEVNFTVRFSNLNTSAYWTDPTSNVQLYIKDTPFTFGDDKSNCISYNYNSSESTCNELPQNTDCTIKFNVEKDKTYYLLWNCKSYNYGGTLVKLSDVVITFDD